MPNHEQPNTALGCITPKQKLALAASHLLLRTVAKGGAKPTTIYD